MECSIGFIKKKVVHILFKLAHRLELMQAVMILLAVAMFP